MKKVKSNVYNKTFKFSKFSILCSRTTIKKIVLVWGDPQHPPPVNAPLVVFDGKTGGNVVERIRRRGVHSNDNIYSILTGRTQHRILTTRGSGRLFGRTHVLARGGGGVMCGTVTGNRIVRRLWVAGCVIVSNDNFFFFSCSYGLRHLSSPTLLCASDRTDRKKKNTADEPLVSRVRHSERFTGRGKKKNN